MTDEKEEFSDDSIDDPWLPKPTNTWIVNINIPKKACLSDCMCCWDNVQMATEKLLKCETSGSTRGPKFLGVKRFTIQENFGYDEEQKKEHQGHESLFAAEMEVIYDADNEENVNDLVNRIRKSFNNCDVKVTDLGITGPD